MPALRREYRLNALAVEGLFRVEPVRGNDAG